MRCNDSLLGGDLQGLKDQGYSKGDEGNPSGKLLEAEQPGRYPTQEGAEHGHQQGPDQYGADPMLSPIRVTIRILITALFLRLAPIRAQGTATVGVLAPDQKKYTSFSPTPYMYDVLLLRKNEVPR